jgi:hypothetical protein
MTDERLTLLLRRALLDNGPEGENAWRILAKQLDPSTVRVVQPRTK